MALALPDDGVLVACDVSEEYANIGKPFWKEVSFFNHSILPLLEDILNNSCSFKSVVSSQILKSFFLSL